MSDETPKISLTMMAGGDVWRIYHELGDGYGRYVDVTDYDAIKDYVLGRRARSGLLDCFPFLKDGGITEMSISNGDDDAT